MNKAPEWEKGTEKRTASGTAIGTEKDWGF